jgi:hypothetical protein
MRLAYECTIVCTVRYVDYYTLENIIMVLMITSGDRKHMLQTPRKLCQLLIPDDLDRDGYSCLSLENQLGCESADEHFVSSGS